MSLVYANIHRTGTESMKGSEANALLILTEKEENAENI